MVPPARPRGRGRGVELGNRNSPKQRSRNVEWGSRTRAWRPPRPSDLGYPVALPRPCRLALRATLHHQPGPPPRRLTWPCQRPSPPSRRLPGARPCPAPPQTPSPKTGTGRTGTPPRGLYACRRDFFQIPFRGRGQPPLPRLVGPARKILKPICQPSTGYSWVSQSTSYLTLP